MAVLFAAPLAYAQEQPEGDDAPDARIAPEPARIDAEQLQKLVEQLSDPDPQRRFDATARFISQRDISLRDVEGLLRRSSLNPEQRHRLLNIAQYRFFNEPRGALGFTSQEIIGEHGVPIQSVVAGFPASTVLRAGDRIMEVDGKPIAGFNAIRPLIISRDPGDVLDLSIRRDGETIKLKAQLGYFNRLQSPRIDQSVLMEAWELRSAPLSNPLPEPIASGLQLAQWSGAQADAPIHIIEVAPLDRSQTEGEAGVVMGGEPRGGTTPADSQWQEGGIQIHPGVGRLPQGRGFDQLEQQRRTLLITRDSIDSRLAMPDVQPEQRRMLEEQRAQIQLEIRRLELLAEQRRLEELRRER